MKSTIYSSLMAIALITGSLDAQVSSPYNAGMGSMQSPMDMQRNPMSPMNHSYSAPLNDNQNRMMSREYHPYEPAGQYGNYYGNTINGINNRDYVPYDSYSSFE